MHLQNVNMLHLLWLLPVVAALYFYAAYRRRVALQAFAQADLLKHLNVSISLSRRRWKLVAILIAITLVVLALTRPGWNPKAQTLERRGRDIVFLLDVSRSMLAQDLSPNRLERAKLAILDCVEKLQGDRVALVIFAGTPVVKCPLTLEYGFFRMMLAGVSPKDISRGGTLIGDALRRTMDDVFDDQQKKYKDIVLITDGEDHDSFPEQAAQEAGRRGIRLIAIGLGDENQGKRIPITDEAGNSTFLKYQGREIWSKLDADTLRKMVNATAGGKYLNVATGAIDMDSVYNRILATAEKKDLEATTVELYEEKFQIFLAVAFALLAMEMVIRERKRI